MELYYGLRAINRKKPNEKIDLTIWENIYSINYYFLKDYRNPPRYITLTKKRLKQLLNDINAVLHDTTMSLGSIATGKTKNTPSGLKPEMSMGLKLTNVQVAKSRIPVPNDDFFGDGIYNEKYVEDLKLVRQEIIQILKDINFTTYKLIYYKSVCWGDSNDITTNI